MYIVVYAFDMLPSFSGFPEPKRQECLYPMGPFTTKEAAVEYVNEQLRRGCADHLVIFEAL